MGVPDAVGVGLVAVGPVGVLAGLLTEGLDVTEGAEVGEPDGLSVTVTVGAGLLVALAAPLAAGVVLPTGVGVGVALGLEALV